MAGKVTGSNFFDKLASYLDESNENDEEGRRFHNLFRRVSEHHANAADDDKDNGTVTVDPSGDGK